MSWSLLGRFFGVPLVIVAAIVGGAVTVVTLFGGPAAPKQQTVDQLLQALEASSGEKSAGILLPREKELWQTALELSERLKNKSAELPEGGAEVAATRLADMVRSEMTRVDQVTVSGDELAKQRALQSARFEFLLRALARTETQVGLSTLIEVVERGQEPYVSVAIQELANLHGLPDSQTAVAPILAVLAKSDRPETLLVASTALSVLASKNDQRVTGVLASVRLANDGEVAWSAALALARLGSDAGKSTLLDMLDRSFWETGERYEVIDEKGNVLRYRMPPERVKALLVASVEAASNLRDPQLWEAIESLKADPSHEVQGAVMRALGARQTANADTRENT